jgi:predicted ATP-grasp superfamily ATP-dependent carboligase
VKFFLKYRQLLQQHYLIDMPCDETINLLLDKNLFSDFAGKNGIRIPPGIHINDSTNLRSISGSFRFPCILKPYLRNPDWRKAGMPKAFFVQNYHELEAACEKAFTVEPNLILQEWIPGQDHNVHYCLSFYGKPGERIASFSGMKIRQYPVDTGSTASTKAFDNEWIKQETDRIFRLVNYTGFGSVEYKKHEDDQMYYLIEPTAGRLNQQEYVSTLNGVNLPLRAYNYLTGCNIPEKMSPEQKNVVYIDELAECASTLFLFRKKRLTFREYCQSIQGPKAWRYSNFLDPGVGLGLFPKVCNMLISRHD